MRIWRHDAMMAFYDAAFALSMGLSLVCVFLWRRHFDASPEACCRSARPELENYYRSLK